MECTTFKKICNGEVNDKADDTQVYGWSPPAHVDDLLKTLSACFDDISHWMRSNRLQLNMDKTEFM
jgi:hypothetical protein